MPKPFITETTIEGLRAKLIYELKAVDDRPVLIFVISNNEEGQKQFDKALGNEVNRMNSLLDKAVERV